MHETIKHIATACASMMLLACASGGKSSMSLWPEHGAAAPKVLPATQFGNSADDYYVLGRNQHAAERVLDARIAYQHALALDPSHVNARNGLAVLSAGQGEYGQAIALWQSLTEGHGEGRERAFLFSNLGYAYVLSADYEQALSALEQAGALDPQNPSIWQNIASVLEKLGRHERAAEMLSKAGQLQNLAPGAQHQPSMESSVSAAHESMAHIEVTQSSSGLLELRRIDARMADTMPAAPLLPPAPPAVPLLPLIPSAPSVPLNGGSQITAKMSARPGRTRLEIRNGNGVRGMAALLARTVGADTQVVKLSNAATFSVAHTRLEYRPGHEAAARLLATKLGVVEIQKSARGEVDVVLVLGLDQRNPASLRRRFANAPKLAQTGPGDSLKAG